MLEIIHAYQIVIEFHKSNKAVDNLEYLILNLYNCIVQNIKINCLTDISKNQTTYIGPGPIPIRQASTRTADDVSYSVASFVVSFCDQFCCSCFERKLIFSVYI